MLLWSLLFCFIINLQSDRPHLTNYEYNKLNIG